MTSKSIEVIYCSPTGSMSSFRAMGAGNVELSLWQAFCVQGYCDLDIWSDDFKSKGVIYWSGPTSKSSLRTKAQALLSYHSDKLGHCDLDLSPDDLTINRGHLDWPTPAFMSSYMAIGEVNVQLSLGQSFRIQGYCDLDLWHNYLNIKRGYLLVTPASMSSWRSIGGGNVELSLRQAFQVQGHCDLEFWPNDLKINRGHLLSGPASIPSLRAMGACNVELSLAQIKNAGVRVLTRFSLKLDSDLVFDHTWPIFELGLDIIRTNFLINVNMLKFKMRFQEC